MISILMLQNHINCYNMAQLDNNLHFIHEHHVQDYRKSHRK